MFYPTAFTMYALVWQLAFQLLWNWLWQHRVTSTKTRIVSGVLFVIGQQITLTTTPVVLPVITHAHPLQFRLQTHTCHTNSYATCTLMFCAVMSSDCQSIPSQPIQ
eukprot:TRINITY_DN67949_c5_g16_i1.p2 TRINITY_DN67949_c5_g16~~TRINITY_DN67949_c5_g16_i1.p2  ORF type:complete len:106 (-),score=4.04 TRINITY_DN67949_c5_g16_i1:800-1117(-)